MYDPTAVRGVLAMMPAFATANAADLQSVSTVDVPNLTRAVDRIIRDGIDAIATTGTFGEFHTLLPEEFRSLCEASIEAVRDRVPLFIGCTAVHTRQTIRNIQVAIDAGAAGVFVGLPYYVPLDVRNAVRFLGELADLFPATSFMIYHNPPLQRVLLPTAAFSQIASHKNIVAMKDSHRDTRAFIELEHILDGRISVFVGMWQYHPYAELGAAGLWSYDCWMGPAPLIALRNAVSRGDRDLAASITRDIHQLREGPPNLEWREMAARVAIPLAGYCDPGPLRPPFLEIPDEVQRAAQRRAERWRKLQEFWAVELAKGVQSAPIAAPGETRGRP
jgi:dihydrodipicolinate synthase/N-acetylneuraminate lyase